MQTFKWGISPNMVVNSEPKVKVIRFGDGYEQRVKSGLNSLLRQYSVTMNTLREEGIHIDNFLTEHGAVTPFLWENPQNHKTVLVICRKWDINVKYSTASISAIFEEVLA